MINEKTVIRELETHARKFLMDEFDLGLNVPIILNGRLKTSLGRFISRRDLSNGNRTPIRIEISTNYVRYNDWKEIIGTLEHECVHYALCKKKLPYSDSDQTFINACTSRGVKLSGTSTAKLPHVEIECEECGHKWLQRTARIKGYIHSNCGGSLKVSRRNVIKE